METHQLRYFLAVAEHGNFRRASEALRVAQSALSRHVAELEARIGVQLLERLPRGVRLTPAGLVFAEETRRAMETLHRARFLALKATTGEIGHVVVGLNELAARNARVAGAFHRFHRDYPDIRLEYELMRSIDQNAALEHGKIDIAILSERPNDQNLAYLPVGDDPFVIALPAIHELAVNDCIDARQLAGEPFVAVKMSAYWLAQTRLLGRCMALGLSPRIAHEAPNDQMQLALIAAGAGIGFVNASAGERSGRDVALRPLRDLDMSLKLDLVWRPALATPSTLKLVAAFRETLAASQ